MEYRIGASKDFSHRADMVQAATRTVECDRQLIAQTAPTPVYELAVKAMRLP